MEALKQLTEMQNKIDNLKEKLIVETEIFNRIGEIKFSLVCDDPKTWFLTCLPKNKGEIKTILESLKPKQENKIIKTSNHKIEIESPFKIELINPCRPNNYSDFEVRIIYKCELDFDVWITYSIEDIKEFLITSSRNITDSEYHYFTGVSMRELREMTVRLYKFNVNNGEYLNMYGGNQYLLNVEMINNIISKLTEE